QDEDIDHSDTECEDLPNNTSNYSDPIQELFTRVFVNDSLTCASPMEKLYYSAKIYPLVCYLCSSSSVSNNPKEKMASKTIRPTCDKCTGLGSSKKRYGWKPISDRESKKS
ncbi:11364_t:CDS:1, partial [Scutellospora calospora]